MNDLYGESCPIYLNIWMMLKKVTNDFNDESGNLHIDKQFNISDVESVLKRYYNNVSYYGKNDSNQVQFIFKDKRPKE